MINSLGKLQALNLCERKAFKRRRRHLRGNAIWPEKSVVARGISVPPLPTQVSDELPHGERMQRLSCDISAEGDMWYEAQREGLCCLLSAS